MHLNRRTGILLINLGTPAAPNVGAVRAYLKEFLSDPRVVELPGFLRWLLVNVLILPLRAKRTMHAYAAIWQAAGSPLLINSVEMRNALQNMLGDEYKVALGMRYGAPSIAMALEQLYAAEVGSLLVIPLFPQYSSAVNGSALELTLRLIASKKVIMPCKIITDFNLDPEYLRATAEIIRPYMREKYYTLLSFHGLPERQLINPGVDCYKTKCLQTAAGIAHELGLAQNQYSVSFQSRLGRLPWIKPYTDETLISLRTHGVKNIIIACPSFVTDCLETLEEIGIRAKEQWLQLGGEQLQLVPCLNAHPTWINALHALVKKNVV